MTAQVQFVTERSFPTVDKMMIAAHQEDDYELEQSHLRSCPAL